MTNEEILEKAIEKAKENGWETDIISVNPGYENTFIFNHGFAKAFWGEIDSKENGLAWQYHLKIMVLEEEPLKFLRIFL